MIRVLPSSVVRAIEVTYPWAADGKHDAALQLDQSVNLGTTVRLIEAIPHELLPIGEDGARLFTAVAAMQSAVDRWASGGHQGLSTPLYAMSALGGHPVTVAVKILRTCPDDAPAWTEVELAFIRDPKARRSIRLDMTNADRAIGNAEWKSAMVLAGSVIEALTLWAISSYKEAEIPAAAAAWKKEAAPGTYNGRVERDPPEKWHAPELIEIAFQLGELEESTRDAARLAANYRNLIHPGRVLRTGADATEGSAKLVTGAMRLVADDIMRRHG